MATLPQLPEDGTILILTNSVFLVSIPVTFKIKRSTASRGGGGGPSNRSEIFHLLNVEEKQYLHITTRSRVAWTADRKVRNISGQLELSHPGKDGSVCIKGKDGKLLRFSKQQTHSMLDTGDEPRQPNCRWFLTSPDKVPTTSSPMAPTRTIDIRDGDAIRLVRSDTLDATPTLFVVHQQQKGDKTFRLLSKSEPHNAVFLGNLSEASQITSKKRNHASLLKLMFLGEEDVCIGMANMDPPQLLSMKEDNLNPHHPVSLFSHNNPHCGEARFFFLRFFASGDDEHQRSEKEPLQPDGATPEFQREREFPPAATSTTDGAKKPEKSKSHLYASDALGPALTSICLQNHWKAASKLARMKQLLLEHPLPASTPAMDITALTRCVIATAYNIPNTNTTKLDAQKDDMTQHNIRDGIHALQRVSKPTRVDAFMRSLAHLASWATQDDLHSLLSELCDRAQRCPSAQHHAVNLVIVKGGDLVQRRRLLETKDSKTTQQVPSSADSNTTAAFSRMNSIFEDYLDDFKHKAFASAMIEPLRYGFQIDNNHHDRDHVNVHGINWLLTVCNVAAGMEMPDTPLDDPHFMSIREPWGVLRDSAWECFKKPENFGKAFEGVSGLDASRDRPSGKTLPPAPVSGHVPDFRKQLLLDDATRKGWAKCVERFAYFFSAEFFIKRALENLNAETKAEQQGFRHAMSLLFAVFKTQHPQYNLGDVDVDTFCYKDDMFVEPNVQNIHVLFAWLGFCTEPLDSSVSLPLSVDDEGTETAKDPGSSSEGEGDDDKEPLLAELRSQTASELFGSLEHDALSPKKSRSQRSIVSNDNEPHLERAATDPMFLTMTNRRTCPICFEESPTDLVSIPHAGGDVVNGHVCCRVCFESMASKEEFLCPFCRAKVETGASDLVPLLLEELQGALLTGDRHQYASVFSVWEMIVVSQSTSPLVIYASAAEILAHPSFLTCLSNNKDTYNDLIGEMCGLLFTLHALVREAPSELLTTKHQSTIESHTAPMLLQVVNTIMHPFREGGPLIVRDGHILGAMYSQCLAALSCSYHNGLPTETLLTLTRELAIGIVVGHQAAQNPLSTEERKKVMERVPHHLLNSTSVLLWSKKEDDIFSQCFA